MVVENDAASITSRIPILVHIMDVLHYELLSDARTFSSSGAASFIHGKTLDHAARGPWQKMSICALQKLVDRVAAELHSGDDTSPAMSSLVQSWRQHFITFCNLYEAMDSFAVHLVKDQLPKLASLYAWPPPSRRFSM